MRPSRFGLLAFFFFYRQLEDAKIIVRGLNCEHDRRDAQKLKRYMLLLRMFKKKKKRGKVNGKLSIADSSFSRFCFVQLGTLLFNLLFILGVILLPSTRWWCTI